MEEQGKPQKLPQQRGLGRCALVPEYFKRQLYQYGGGVEPMCLNVVLMIRKNNFGLYQYCGGVGPMHDTHHSVAMMIIIMLIREAPF